MITGFDPRHKVWVAAGRGPMRAIVAEADTEQAAMIAFAEQHAAQVQEEKDFAREYEESAVADHFSEKAFENIFGKAEDLG